MKLTRRPCPGCGHKEIAKQISDDELRYWQNIASTTINANLRFVGRQRPQPSPWLWVNCPDCSLSFVVLAPNESWISQIYQRSGITTDIMDELAAENAVRVWQSVMNAQPERSSVIDFGCGRGHFLHRLKQQDPQVQDVLGIEINADLRAQSQLPSHQVIAGLEDEVERRHIAEKTNRWSVLSAQLSLEHLLNPDLVLQGLSPYLSDPSYCFFLYHDGEGLMHQLLGEESPLFDIQHFQLFNPQAMRAFLNRQGFHVLHDQSYRNTYPAAYWLTLLGLSQNTFPNWLLRLLQNTRVSLKAGNRVVVARRDYQMI